MIEYKYDIDMTPGRVPLEVSMKQYDTDFAIVFSLIARKGELNLESGATAKIRGTKADGYGYSVDATLDIAKKTVTVQGDEQMTIVKGKAPFELVILKGTKILNTATFYLRVYPAALSDDSKISESQIDDFHAAAVAAQQAANAANEAANQAAAAAASKREAASSAQAAAGSEEAAEQAVQDAAAALQIIGDATFSVNEDNSVTMHITKED